MKNIFLCAFVMQVASANSAEMIPCPPMPISGNTITHDVKSGVEGSVGSLGRISAGKLAVNTEIKASALLGNFPSIDQIIILQTMSATYCGMLTKSNLSSSEIISRWEIFQDKVLRLQSESAGLPRPKPVPEKSTNAAGEGTIRIRPDVPVTGSDVGVNSSMRSTTRFSKTQCGAIKDTSTGREWFIGADKNTSWKEARTWVQNLNTCGGGWKMPVTSQLRALFAPGSSAGQGYLTEGKRWPAHLDPIFSAIGDGSWVWAASKVGSDVPVFYNFNEGVAVEFEKFRPEYSTRAFAIR